MSKHGGSRADRPLLGFPKKQEPKVYVGWCKTEDAIIIVASATKKGCQNCGAAAVREGLCLACWRFPARKC